MSRYIVLDRTRFKLLLDKDRVALLQSVCYLLETKRLSINDTLFCVQGFNENGYLHEAVIFLREALRSYPKNHNLYKIFIK
ncbi:MAG: hypothetical protein WC274_09535, partial [Sulfurimonas sp.]